MKYIIYDNERVLIFDESLNHNSAVMLLNISKSQVVSAGKIKLDPDLGLICYGESISLNKKYRSEDVRLINQYFLNS